MAANSALSARPAATAWVANGDCCTRSAHNPPHHARSLAVANVQVELLTVTSPKPAVATHAGRKRPGR